MEIHASGYYYRPGALGRKAGETRRCIPLGRDLEVACAVALRLERDLQLAACGGTRKGVQRALTNLLSQARHRAKSQGVPCSLTRHDIEEMYLQSGGKCAVSKLPFSSLRAGHRASPWAMSLDRIEPRHGYVPGNVRLVCLIVNVALNEWGLHNLKRMARALVAPRPIPETSEIHEETGERASVSR